MNSKPDQAMNARSGFCMTPGIPGGMERLISQRREHREARQAGNVPEELVRSLNDALRRIRK